MMGQGAEKWGRLEESPKKKKEKLATKLRLVFKECKAIGFSSDEITEIFSETF